MSYAECKAQWLTKGPYMCNKNLCTKDKSCACRVKKKPCAKSQECQAQVEGECMSNTDCIKMNKKDNLIICDTNMCNPESDKCVCKYKKLQECVDVKNQCKKRNGKCMLKSDCVIASNLQCVDDLCLGEEDCTCAIEEEVPCFKDDACLKKEGVCTKNELGCDLIGVNCDFKLCNPDDVDCFCKHRNISPGCYDVKNQCKKRNGKCMLKSDCVIASNLQCVDDLCLGEEDCTCAIEEEVPCFKDDACLKKEGVCTKNELGCDNTGVVCDFKLCNPDDVACFCKYESKVV